MKNYTEVMADIESRLNSGEESVTISKEEFKVISDKLIDFEYETQDLALELLALQGQLLTPEHYEGESK